MGTILFFGAAHRERRHRKSQSGIRPIRPWIAKD